MSKPVFGLLSGMSGTMIAALAGTLVLCAYGTFMLESKRTLPNDYHTLDATITESQEMINEYAAAPVLPPLTESWREVSSFMALHGLVLKPDDGSMASGSTSAYEGPLKSWGGSVSGNAKNVLAAVKKAQQMYPMFLLDYKAGDGTFTMNLAVVGI